MKKLFAIIFIIIAAVFAAACHSETAKPAISAESDAVFSKEDDAISFIVIDESVFEAVSDETDEKSSDEAFEETSDASLEEYSEEATEGPSDEPTEESTDEPTDEPTEEPIDELTEEPIEELSEERSDEHYEDISEDIGIIEPENRYQPTELEAEALRLINVRRAEHGLDPLEFNTEIYDCARIRTEEIIVCWGHTRPNGENFRTVYEENGFDWKKYWTGENLAGRFVDMESAIEALMNSEGHRKNLLCPEYDSVAICAIHVGDGKFYMTQLFLG